ncbi:glycosyltransferase family 39 protein [Aquimonas voraii]|nr:glycosyltransferase family 39 protein [Aquimonas voraii]
MSAPSAWLPRLFWGGWALLLLGRALLAAQLPLFGDEAFYAWESRRPAWAYSDLPGLTAWGILLGRMLLESELGIRLTSLLLGAVLPLQLMRIADAAGLGAWRWQAGLLALLLPLLSINGLLALPEPPLLMAAALCLHALLRLQALRTAAPFAAVAPPLVELLLGLVLGALTHYRFLAVLAAGGLAVLCVPSARRLLGDLRLWAVGLLGLAAWLPLLLFDAGGEQAGWRFQFVERHPWAFQPVALAVPIEQALLSTPLAWLLMLLALPRAWRERVQSPGPALLAFAGGGLLLGLFLIGLFADRERVSFHWPLVGQLALLPLLARRLAEAGTALRRWTWGLLGAGSAAVWTLCLLLALPSGRAALAQRIDLADNFTDISALSAALEARLAMLPSDTRVIADNFLLAARLVQSRGGDAGFGVLDHARNAKHGRARQLALWAQDESAWLPVADAARLVVVEETALGLGARQPWQQQLCARLPGLRWVDEVQLHGGALRYLLFEQRADAGSRCRLAPLAYLDTPLDGQRVPARFPLSGWAIRDVDGLARVEVLLDGALVAQARSDLDFPGVLAQWPSSDDPRHPRVGIEADVEVPATLRGTRQLSLRLIGPDGRARVLPMAKLQIAD